MARLLHGGVELQRSDYDVWFEFLDGGPADYTYEVRGEDHVIPARPGQYVMNRVPHRLGIILVGWVEGQGSTHAAKREDYLSLWSELQAVWDPAEDPAPLIAFGPVAGIGAGDAMSLNARFIRKTGPAPAGEYFRRFTVTLECVDEPPIWVPGS